ncbi:uncharacterized protein LOC120293367 [Eucalyptus grandis]|uniref:uncharacterized protein LOC120293367 n=1 Tax=Eucalyptus grandis TaxID=71139 RepID=UPI00192E8C99|nr:uncharacterized protein LOC120293367 [Eucalyptus grandis]
MAPLALFSKKLRDLRMGNCSIKGDAEKSPSTKKSGNFRVLTDAGVVVEFQGPKIVQDVLDHYPGYGVYRQGRASSQLPCDERLAGANCITFFHCRRSKGRNQAWKMSAN